MKPDERAIVFEVGDWWVPDPEDPEHRAIVGEAVADELIQARKADANANGVWVITSVDRSSGVITVKR